MAERLFKGTYGIVLTPFTESGNVDFALLEKYTAKISESEHINGLVVCGSTGEFTRLSFDENVELMKTVKNAIKPGKQFICGATAGDGFNAKKYIQKINEIGADGILLAPPYYFTLTDEEIFAYYKDVAASNEKKTPILGYNIPQCTNNVSVANFERLLDIDCIKGYKNSWNDMQEITSEIALRNAKRPDVSMLTGLDACLYGTLALGGDGLFTAITYLMPEVMYYIYKMYKAEPEKSFACQAKLIQLINIVNRFTFPYGYRVLSEALDMPLGYGREEIPEYTRAKADASANEMRAVYKSIMNFIGGF